MDTESCKQSRHRPLMNKTDHLQCTCSIFEHQLQCFQ